MSDVEKIPFEVDITRVIEVLATQIYQSPLALLRENTQNAFDAILLRMHRGDQFEPKINVEIAPEVIEISDNGLGMTANDLKEHFWRAGSSSKNTEEAREAGVVGTFGIGAMANFGIADVLEVETESALTHERTTSRALRETLSATEECIEMRSVDSLGEPGTRVRASIPAAVLLDVNEAMEYLTEFVGLVAIRIDVNGKQLPARRIDDLVSQPKEAKAAVEENVEVAAGVNARLAIRIDGTGEVWARISDLTINGQPEPGQLVVRQSGGPLRTFRSGFGLATVSLSSAYQFGGVADMRMLEPTAGREALSTSSMQILQSMVTMIEKRASEVLGSHRESDQNVLFLHWVSQHRRWDLCGNLLIRAEPGTPVRLHDISVDKERIWLVYEGSDALIIKAHASEDSLLLIPAARKPRRSCELGYLQAFCQVERVSDAPQVLGERVQSEWSVPESATVFRIVSVLESDYFLKTEVRLGKLSHGVPLLVIDGKSPIQIVLDPDASTFQVLLNVFESEYDAFGSVVKDYVRNLIFGRVSHLVPSSTRQGAQAFLQTIQRHREVFEYEWSDMDDLTSIWDEYLDGKLSMLEAAQRSSYVAARNVQVVDASAAQTVQDVIPDVVESERVLATDPQDLDVQQAVPAILRLSVESDAKLLTVPEGDSPLRGYRCFIALSDRAREQRGEFFLQPHRTSVVWGGQKVLFIFQHHSGRFGLYYDLQTRGVVARESGGGAFITSTLVLKNRIYIPVPEIIQHAFLLEENERKRFDVRCELLYTESDVFEADEDIYLGKDPS